MTFNIRPNVDQKAQANYCSIDFVVFLPLGAQSVLAYATVNGYICGLDLRSNKEVWKLRNDAKSGRSKLHRYRK